MVFPRPITRFSLMAAMALKRFTNSNCDGRLDVRMRIVTDEFEVFELEVMDAFDSGVELEHGQRPGLACQLQTGLLQVIGVKMQIAERVDECAGLEAADMRHH